MLDDTIAAIATPLGQGGLAVIRTSGHKALLVGDSLFIPVGKSKAKLAEAKTHTLHYGHIAQGGRRLDEVIVSVMKAPATFTREDIVEISCHGGMRSTQTVLDAALSAGARLALPGEFTKRGRFRDSLIEAAKFYIPAAVIGLGFLIYMMTSTTLTFSNLQGLCKGIIKA